MLSPQQKFDKTYISSTTIRKILGVSRAAIVFAKNSGRLPAPIVVDNTQLWERESVEPIIRAWLEKRHKL